MFAQLAGAVSLVYLLCAILYCNCAVSSIVHVIIHINRKSNISSLNCLCLIRMWYLCLYIFTHNVIVIVLGHGDLCSGAQDHSKQSCVKT